jgi:hypothetical protein
VVIGVLGEWRYGPKLEDAHDEVNKYDFQKIREADEKAGNAQMFSDAIERQAVHLSRYLQVVVNLTNPRLLDRRRFAELMKGQPKDVAFIWYEQDTEAKFFAEQIDLALGSQGLGWKTQIIAFGLRSQIGGTPKPDLQSAAASIGLAYAAKVVEPTNWKNPVKALSNAINLGLGGWGKGDAEFFEDKTLPGNTILIGVGRHVVNIPSFIPTAINIQKSIPATAAH